MISLLKLHFKVCVTTTGIIIITFIINHNVQSRGLMKLQTHTKYTRTGCWLVTKMDTEPHSLVYIPMCVSLMDEHNFHSNLIRMRPTRFIFFAPLPQPLHALSGCRTEPPPDGMATGPGYTHIYTTSQAGDNQRTHKSRGNYYETQHFHVVTTRLLLSPTLLGQHVIVTVGNFHLTKHRASRGCNYTTHFLD